MYLEFQYSTTRPWLEKRGDVLSIGLLNRALGASVERWVLPDGHYLKRGDFHLIESSECVVGVASVSIQANTLATTTGSLYEQLLNDHPTQALYRIWHFVPGINQQSGDSIENYRAFCLGRATAFERNAGEGQHLKMSAASAVGTGGGHLGLIYLAGRTPARHIENPRQTPAYRYSQKYGPKPPAFARATCVDFAGRPTLFISGTSSILASESTGDTIVSQLATTLQNLQIVAAQTTVPPTGKRLVRVYLRHVDDYAYVKAQLEAHYLHEGDEAYYIQADICRRELLVEIEVTMGI